ncbi:hypothetical protein D3C80_1625110 [compost metagenome]
MLIEIQFGDQERLHDHHAFGMQIAPKLGLALHIGKFAIAQVDYTTDARRFAKAARMPWIIQHRQAVNLTNHLAFGFDHDLAQLNLVLHAFCEIAFTPFAGIQRRF